MSIDKHPPKNGSRHPRWRDPSGRQRTKVFDRKVDAERWMVEVEHRKHVGEYVDPTAGKVTFRDFAETWRERQVHASSTRTQVESYFRLHVYPVLGGMELRGIRPSDVQAWVTGCSKKLAPGSVELVYRYVASVLLDAQQDRLIARTPCVGIKLPAKPKATVRLPTTEQLVAITGELPDRYKVMVLLGAGAGLRLGEALGLGVDQVEFLPRRLRVDRQLLTPNAGEPYFGKPKTPSSVRAVPLGGEVLNGIAAHIATYPVGESGLIVTDDDGLPIRRSKWGHIWSRAAKRAGAEQVRFHDLRHYFASALISAGCSVKAVQSALGHASATETLDTYSHLWPSDDDRTRKAIDLALRSPVNAEGTAQAE